MKRIIDKFDIPKFKQGVKSNHSIDEIEKALRIIRLQIGEMLTKEMISGELENNDNP